MRSLRNFIAFAAVLLVAPALPGAAGAHVEMTTAEAPAGKSVNLMLEIGHGCDGASTISLEVQAPTQASGVKAQSTNGWKASTTGSKMIWKGGPLADHDVQEYPFHATLSGKKGQVLEFPSIQKCEGGASTAWIQSSKGGTEPELPAPTVTLTSTEEPDAQISPVDQQAADDQAAEAGATATGQPTATDGTADDSSEEDDGDSKTVILLVIAGLAIGTVTGLVLRARRARK